MCVCVGVGWGVVGGCAPLGVLLQLAGTLLYLARAPVGHHNSDVMSSASLSRFMTSGADAADQASILPTEVSARGKKPSKSRQQLFK